MSFRGRLAATYRGRRVLVTGHTGFKGSWLVLWLKELGAEVVGVALDPEDELNHWNALGLRIDDNRFDICDPTKLDELIRRVAPEVVFHLAAQALVRRSYAAPAQTWSTNVIGTLNVLESARRVPSVKAVVVVTSDKVYENRNWEWGYRETDPLGGHDPYSSSKAAAELLVSSYRASFLANGEGRLAVATARAGNVVGGGDWAHDRLVPDLARAMMKGSAAEIRNPGSTRPWQHVLDPLHGYLMLGRALLDEPDAFTEAWNFGPPDYDELSVADVLHGMKVHWPELEWRTSADRHPAEAARLRVDSAKARLRLGWRQRWGISKTLHATARWYGRFMKDGEVCSREQLAEFVAGVD